MATYYIRLAAGHTSIKLPDERILNIKSEIIGYEDELAMEHFMKNARPGARVYHKPGWYLPQSFELDEEELYYVFEALDKYKKEKKADYEVIQITKVTKPKKPKEKAKA